jgi:hypothetical protein
MILGLRSAVRAHDPGQIQVGLRGAGLVHHRLDGRHTAIGEPAGGGIL